MPLSLITVTPPAADPVSLAEAKEHLRVSGTDQDSRITAFIKAATASAENETNRAFVTRTLRLYLQSFPTHRDPRGSFHHRHGHGLEDPFRPSQMPGGFESHLISHAAAPIVLPKPNLQSVTSVKYVKEDDTVLTVNPSLYRVDTAAEPGKIVLKNDEEWPTDELKSVNGVEVEFVAGYGAAASVPEAIKIAIMMIVGHMFENRETVVVGEGRSVSVREIPMSASWVLAPYRVFDYVAGR